MEYEMEKARVWLEKMGSCKEPIMIAITNHLYTEYALDYLISSSVPNKSKVLGYNFATKLNFVYGLGLLEKELYENIDKLNKIRNKYAHKLDADFSKLDLDFFDPNGQVNICDFKVKIEANPQDKQLVIDCLLWIGVVTFGWLHNQINQQS